MSFTLARRPGWDSKVRSEAVRAHGSLRAYAAHLDLDVSDIPAEGRRSSIKVWSRIVAHFGSTEQVLADLDGVLS